MPHHRNRDELENFSTYFFSEGMKFFESDIFYNYRFLSQLFYHCNHDDSENCLGDFFACNPTQFKIIDFLTSADLT